MKPAARCLPPPGAGKGNNDFAAEVNASEVAVKMKPGAAGNREHANDSHPNVSTCNTAQLARPQIRRASARESVAETGSKVRREACGKSFVAVCPRAAGSFPPVPCWLGRDCG
jgi:hypothetical protein